ncbi:MAG: glycosyltransferase, partial [Candidatus Bathyarchaeota archaeon]|nr:glycosyltransferase [Candidatus Bathyarchaeota archaeon]
MRILVVQESDWLEKGPHQSHHLMERLSARGHEVRAIDFEIQWDNHGKAGTFSKRKVFRGVHKAIEEGTVTVCRPSIVNLPVLDYVSLVISHTIELRRQIREFRPDVIVGFGILNARIAMALAEPKRIPFVYYVIDELHRLVPNSVFRGIAKHIEKNNMRNATLVVSINEMLKEYTVAMGAKERDAVAIGAGVDFAKFDLASDREKVRAEHGFSDTDIVLFYMGWLYTFSGIKEIVTMLMTKQPVYRGLKLMIVGKGDLWPSLQDLKKRMALDNTLVTLEWQPHDRIPSLISASDICLLPANKNDIMKNIVPIKMYEYMAAG